MCRFIFFLLIVVPAVELTILIKIGGHMGALETIALVLLTAMLGLRMFRYQSASMPLRLQRGELEPNQAVLEGTLLSLGALCLLIPGFITDILGAICLIPFLRKLLAKRLLKRFEAYYVQMSASNQDTVIVVEGTPTDEGRSERVPPPASEVVVVLEGETVRVVDANPDGRS